MHPHFTTTISIWLSSTTTALTYSIPSNLAQIYNDHKSTHCTKPLATGFTDGQTSSPTFTYCGDIPNAIFLHSSSNQYDNMDIDCDGTNPNSGNCGNDPSIQPQTTFQDQVSQYGISDLDANVHPYVVFGNTDFDPQGSGMEPLSVMAVVCGGEVVYGIWGDTNGGDATGEASIALAELCSPGTGITGDNGHTADDVMYIGFTGKEAIPGNTADWMAGNKEDFEDSIRGIGERLVGGLVS
ncbi:fungal chitosanase [Aspergillus sclerotioniger CBS 115572]|uniref:Endo-chitosanase n=1 Tax=Aspergillus sclerotioniger CBS 115572 TaxID=1450535 RepID=A0A317X923_9EURO|nr:fungal chitosanase [Aspergillus sclerotioniger CBS 115572]PWY93418.1 fungal chitosanase [Aspergillus sclerotioniger CBS 115572]